MIQQATQEVTTVELSAPFIQRIIYTHLKNIKEGMAQRMMQNKRNVSGRSVRSLDIELTMNGGTLTGSGSWLAMERGRRGGRVPRNFQQLIRDWIIQKGIAVKPIPYKRPSVGKGLSPYERGLRSMAGAIAYTIMKKGTFLHRSGGFNNIYSSPIKDELEIMEKELLTYVSETINTIHRTHFNL